MSGARTTRSRARKPSSASLSSGIAKPISEPTPKPRPKHTAQSQLSPTSRRKSTRGRTRQAQDVWCICRGPDDLTPMIRCEFCKDWFHFACIGLSEREAEDIQLYICQACHEKTGQSTVHEWEGPDAVEECLEDGAETVVSKKAKAEKVVDLVDDPGDEDDDVEVEDASEDDYKEELPESLGVRRGRGTKIITSSDDEHVSVDEEPSRRVSSRRSQFKRKRERESHPVPRKRPRKPSSEMGTDSEDAGNKQSKPSRIKVKMEKHTSILDPTRKYCSGKLRDVLLPIFVQFASSQGAEEAVATEPDEETRKRAEEEGTGYVQDLEQCLFETYGEIDKHGIKTAAGKYKDRFRMLSFNLSQPDRHVLRRNIGTHALPASQLSKMSSVELANEQTKLQIEAANRESLEHSILVQRPIAARAKITHKGEEVIEDLVGDDVGRRIRDEELRETEREREREKDAREKAKIPPPLSPKEKITYRGPQDILAQQHSAASLEATQVHGHARQSPVLATSPATELLEPAFKFDDLIAIDLPEGSPLQEATSPEVYSHPAAPSMSPSAEKKREISSMQTSIPPSPQKIRSASFDLSNVWSGSPPENVPPVRSGSPIPPRTDDSREGPTIDIDLGTAADDEDFDIFLDQADASTATPRPTGPEEEQAAFEALPIVWSGHLNLPDAGKAPAVQARQVGGRAIDISSNQWHILFPSHPASQLKVDGRVPVKESAKYMTQNRLNVTRELIVVALTPSSDRTDFDEIISFLINRDRHAVVHPWGPNPSPEAPGKELYLIPIMPHDALPDYVEILDLVKFPKQRSDRVLLGVFVLNKGKFSERVPARPFQPPVPQTPSTSEAPLTTTTAPPSSNLQTPSIPQEIVSKLTPQQIESLLQTVLSGGMSSLPLSQPQLSPQQMQPQPHPPATFPPAYPSSLASLMPQQQFSPVPYTQYPSTGLTPTQQHQYPSQPTQQSPPMPYNYPPPPQNLPSSSPHEHDYRRSPPYGNDHLRPGEFGGRRGSGRGNGRNFNIERGRSNRGEFERPRDSGWGGRGRGRGNHQRSPPRP